MKSINWHERGSGQTQWMLEHVVESIQQGQPFSRVVAHTQFYAKQLLVRLHLMLNELDIEHKKTLHNLTIEADGCIVKFVSRDSIERERRGTRGWGEFWDHYADGIE